jgi:hypothetical protein
MIKNQNLNQQPIFFENLELIVDKMILTTQQNKSIQQLILKRQ